MENKRKSRTVAFLLCAFLGTLGVHRFYLGKVGTGVLYLFTCGILLIGNLVDIIKIWNGMFPDSDGNPLSEWSPLGIILAII